MPSFQLLQGEAAKRVVADAADPADVHAQTGRADRHVQFGAGDAFGEGFHLRQIAGLRRHEHRHGFTQRDHIRGACCAVVAVNVVILGYSARKILT